MDFMELKGIGNMKKIKGIKSIVESVDKSNRDKVEMSSKHMIDLISTNGLCQITFHTLEKYIWCTS